MRPINTSANEANPRSPSTAREALIAEALGDVARLIDRLEALRPAMDQARQMLTKADKDLAARVVAFEDRMVAITEKAKTVTVEHVARRTHEIAHHSKLDQVQAMKEAARALFNTEFGDTLNGLVRSLQPLIGRLNRPWEPWLTHIATAAVSSASTAVLVWLWLHR